MKLLKYINSTPVLKAGKYILLSVMIISSTEACKKTDYLDTDNAERPPLSAKVKLVNALSVSAPLNFLDFTRQINTSVVNKNTATPYLDTQFGKVQYNTTEGNNTTYKSSYVFGGSAVFIQETDKTAFSGPNGPIASFYHTLFAVPKRRPSKLNPGNRDSLILVYDDLLIPTIGKAKIRFANFSPDAPNLDFSISGGNTLFTNVGYGSFAGQTIITYDENGKSSANIPGLSWKTLAPFHEIDAVAAKDFQIKNNSTNDIIPIKGTGLTNVTFEAGKIYTIFISGSINSSNISATIITHNK